MLNYIAVVGDLIIPAGSKEETTTITVTPINDEVSRPNRVFTVKASVEGTDAQSPITITDDDTETANIKLKAGPAYDKRGRG